MNSVGWTDAELRESAEKSNEINNAYKRGYEQARKEFERPQGDCISRKALLADFKERNIWSKDIVEAINNAQTVEPTRPKGEWTYHTDGYIAFYTCSKCSGFGDIQDKFCKHCGADMRKEDKNENS